MLRQSCRLLPASRRASPCSNFFRTSSPSLCQQRRDFAYPKEGVFQPNSPPRQQPANVVYPQPNKFNDQEVRTGIQYGQPPPPPPGSEQPPKRRSIFVRILRGGFIFGFCSIFFIGAVQWTVDKGLYYASIPFEPDTEEDVEQLQALAEEYEDLPLVKKLRSEVRFENGMQVPVWKEWRAYQGLQGNSSRSEQRLTTGPLRGSAGVGAQSLFYNSETGEVKCLINFGEAMTGWPGSVHGGAIATIADEVMARCAIKSTEKKSAVTAFLHLDYLDFCSTGMWYCLSAKKHPDPTMESTDTKKYVVGTLACLPMEGDPDPQQAGYLVGAPVDDVGHAHVSMSALFVVPKNVELKPLEDEF